MKDITAYNHLITYSIIFFFLNSFLLPHGLLYTTFLTPVMIYYLYKKDKLKYSIFGLLIILIPMPFQIYGGVDLTSYLLSNIIIFTVVIFMITTFFLGKANIGVFDRIFRKALLINSILVIVALIIVPFSSIRGILWYDEILTAGVEVIPRLKLFTYEASYYSMIMMPIFLYFLLRVLYGIEQHSMLILIAVVVPIFLSLSFGVMGALLISFLFVTIVLWSKVPNSMKQFVILGGSALTLLLFALLFIWPDNPVYFRIENIIDGKDTSAMGRLFYSFMFAKDLILNSSILFGIGAGQVKIVAHDMIVNHYQYHGQITEIVRIPNSMAEILAVYGIYGFALKLVLEIYLFMKFKVYNNTYSLVLFTFIFIYQFTGSYITNSAEVAIWAFVFTLKFDEFKLTSPDLLSN